MFDCIIVGNGPAGLSAALYTLRAGYKTAVIGKDGGALEKAKKIENYFGTKTAVSGGRLLQNGLEQVKTLGGVFYDREVIGIVYDGGFTVSLEEQKLTAKAVILATGSERVKAQIKDIGKFEGAGVSYCAICDAFFYRGKDVGVIGNGAYALHEVSDLAPVVRSVTLFTDGKKPEVSFPPGVRIIEDKLDSISGDSVVDGVVVENGSKIPVSGVFVALGSASGGDLAKKLGLAVDKNNRIIVDSQMATAVAGLYAAGDCTGGIQQVSVAVGEGAAAALSAIKFLKTHK